MKKTITCFLFYHTDNQFNKLLNSLLSHPYIDQIYLLTGQKEAAEAACPQCRTLPLDSFEQTGTIRQL